MKKGRGRDKKPRRQNVYHYVCDNPDCERRYTSTSAKSKYCSTRCRVSAHRMAKNGRVWSWTQVEDETIELANSLARIDKEATMACADVLRMSGELATRRVMRAMLSLASSQYQKGHDDCRWNNAAF